MKDLLEQILPLVQKPARYINNELHAIHKDWDTTAIKIALAYPDVYEISMSNVGIQILYHIMNQPADCLAERVFAPWPDMEQQLITHNLPLFSLESYRPLSDFDLVGFSLGYELNYTNVINMLHLGKIPLYREQRTDIDPLVMGGGPSVFNPEPIRDFFDFFVVGDGEEVCLEVIECIRKEKAVSSKLKVESRKEVLRQLANIPGIYVPGISQTVARRCVKDLNDAPYPLKPIVPFIETIHDRAVIEIMRGCPWGCKFCQAGWTSRPVRERSQANLIAAADTILKNTGHEELSLISLSSSDHTQIEPLAKTLAQKYAPARINITLPSMRTNSFSVALAKEVSRVRSSSITLAPEAGTQRLRDIIGKKMTEEDIVEGVRAAFQNQIYNIKLYFMLGLPTETEEDLLGLCLLANKIFDLGKSFSPRIHVTANLSTFIPKPHTPLQWSKQISIEETLAKQSFIKMHMRNRRIEIRWHHAQTSFLEGVFSRGDQSLSKVIVKAWELGARFDAWTEHFKFDLWQQAFSACQVDPLNYLKERPKDVPLPWDYIDTGVKKEILLRAAD